MARREGDVLRHLVIDATHVLEELLRDRVDMEDVQRLLIDIVPIAARVIDRDRDRLLKEKRLKTDGTDVDFHVCRRWNGHLKERWHRQCAGGERYPCRTQKHRSPEQVDDARCRRRLIRRALEE